MSQIWLTTAQVTLPNRPMRLAAIMVFADSREDYESQLVAYARNMQMQYQYQLAPLPLSTYLTRHGRVELLHDAEHLRLEEVKLIYFDKVPSTPLVPRCDYVLRHVVNDVVPLDRQFGRLPKLFAPDEISKLLWPYHDIPANRLELGYADKPQPVFSLPESDERVDARDSEIFGESLPPLNCYMVVDANRHWLFPQTQPRYRCESLYQGELAERAEDSAPYLIEVVPDEMSELLGLFSDKDALTRYSWEDKLGIFIHSRYDFETVRNHLRHFVAIRNETDKWHFFRFYDPVVLQQYMEVIATHPEKLTRFFGYEKRIIHAVASGYDDSFHYYSLKALPDDVRPAPIVMTQWELDGLAQQRWLASRENLVRYILQEYPHIVSDKIQLIDDLEEASQKGYETEKAIMYYTVAKQSTLHQQLDFFAVETKILKLLNNYDECAILLWEQFLEEVPHVRLRRV